MSNKSTLKTINYRVIQNAAASKLAARDIYTARVNIKESYSLVDIASHMVAAGCLAREDAITHVLSVFAKVVREAVAEGRAVNVEGLVRFAPSIRGTFESRDAEWNDAVNTVVVNACTGAETRVAAALSSPNRVDRVTLPVLEALRDFTTQEENTITSEGMFLVTGEHLAWDTMAADEGFFLNCGGEETRCTVSQATETSAVLQTDQIFETAGLPLELFFRTRINGTYYQVQYPHAIVTAPAA